MTTIATNFYTLLLLLLLFPSSLPHTPALRIQTAIFVVFLDRVLPVHSYYTGNYYYFLLRILRV